MTVQLLVNKQELNEIQKILKVEPIISGFYYYKHYICPIYEFNDTCVALLNIPDKPAVAPVLWYETVKPWTLTAPNIIKHVNKKRNNLSKAHLNK